LVAKCLILRQLPHFTNSVIDCVKWALATSPANSLNHPGKRLKKDTKVRSLLLFSVPPAQSNKKNFVALK
jgi:hypothetical protein